MCAAVDLPESVEAWFGRRTHHWRDWSPRALLEAKDRHGLSVSLVVPARNEEDTVGDVISSVRRELVEQHPLLDEVVVIDSDSTDRTASRAARAGA